MVNILGISCFYHDSAAALIQDGKIIAAAQEERFSRVKHDSSFPIQSMRFCLEYAGLKIQDIDFVVIYEKPLSVFEKCLRFDLHAMGADKKRFALIHPYLTAQFFWKKIVREYLKTISDHRIEQIKILFAEHHEAHAASAFYPSWFKDAAILTIDGAGEWTTTAAWIGENNKIRPLWEIQVPHSLGSLYSAFTHYLGFKMTSDEYKVMGLAPYGGPGYIDLIKRHLIDIKADGSYRLNLEYFRYQFACLSGNHKFDELFGGPRRKPGSPITQKHIDIAHAIQNVAEEVILKLSETLHRETGQENLCLAGGVALNCVANGKILRKVPFKNIWIQPGASDEGGAIGSALCVWHDFLNKKRIVGKKDGMQGAYLGPDFSDKMIKDFLDQDKIQYKQLTDKVLFGRVSDSISKGKVVGWFQGRMEFGPRALGNRSILADARNPRMQSILNLKIKHRESFRPFAPAVLKEKVGEYFDSKIDSPTMTTIGYLKESRRLSPGHKRGLAQVGVPMSDLPAVTHVDYSARLQTVDKDTNPRFYKLIKSFESKTGYAVLINTSFNVRKEPIVCTPEDAYKCFMKTEMDLLVMGNILLDKKIQKKSLKPINYFKNKNDRILREFVKKNKLYVLARDTGFAIFGFKNGAFYIKKIFKNKKLDLIFKPDVLTYRKLKKSRLSSNLRKPF